ncbi:hypothetical protein O6H91_22G029900 [Diphasiastrum complanatum]|uniref:Uncharacterized protein n=1 Tax=Diphasiastrum complanatum TaxID=34168 RepID=A0ACC2AE30_DIPCM|nr:hypothetical protein O6H91_22G029900 [Diphasiastrum complanatum]
MGCSKDDSSVMAHQGPIIQRELDKPLMPQQPASEKQLWVFRWIGWSQWKVGVKSQKPSHLWTVISKCYKKTVSSKIRIGSLTSSLWTVHGNERSISKRRGWWPWLFFSGLSKRKGNPTASAYNQADRRTPEGQIASVALLSLDTKSSTPIIQARSLQHGPGTKPGPAPQPH